MKHWLIKHATALCFLTQCFGVSSKCEFASLNFVRSFFFFSVLQRERGTCFIFRRIRQLFHYHKELPNTPSLTLYTHLVEWQVSALQLPVKISSMDPTVSRPANVTARITGHFPHLIHTQLTILSFQNWNLCFSEHKLLKTDIHLRRPYPYDVTFKLIGTKVNKWS
jgi:hypothetical protein